MHHSLKFQFATVWPSVCTYVPTPPFSSNGNSFVYTLHTYTLGWLGLFHLNCRFHIRFIIDHQFLLLNPFFNNGMISQGCELWSLQLILKNASHPTHKYIELCAHKSRKLEALSVKYLLSKLTLKRMKMWYFFHNGTKLTKNFSVCGPILRFFEAFKNTHFLIECRTLHTAVCYENTKTDHSCRKSQFT